MHEVCGTWLVAELWGMLTGVGDSRGVEFGIRWLDGLRWIGLGSGLKFWESVIARGPGSAVGDCQNPPGLGADTSEDRMSQQTIKQQARRTAREMAEKRRREREERERRAVDLAEQVMVAIGERGAAVAKTEKLAGEALRQLTEREGLSLGEAVEWCGETITVRGARRLRRLASESMVGDVGGQGGYGSTLASACSGGAGANSSAG